MGDVSKNFSRHEFACKCGCGLAAVDVRLLEVLQAVRDRFDAKVTINSGCRCQARNDATPGAVPNSWHVKCMAADIVVKDVPPGDVAAFLETLHPRVSIGRYDNRVHVDVRTGGFVRWDMTTGGS